MFKNDRYLTKGVTNVIPYYLQVAMWLAIDSMEVSKKDYLQVFKLSKIVDNGVEKQLVVHTQEQNYKMEYRIPTANMKIVTEKIFVIDDGTHSTMLLAEEY